MDVAGNELADLNTKDLIDQLEAEMLKSDIQVNCPLIHRYTPGLYIREIFMPAGSIIISKIHKTEHPYIVSKGLVTVITEADGEIKIKAPFTGITKAGTRRVLYVHEDTVWTTVHTTVKDGETVEEIEHRIIEPNINNHIKQKDNDLGSSRSSIGSSDSRSGQISASEESTEEASEGNSQSS